MGCPCVPSTLSVLTPSTLSVTSSLLLKNTTEFEAKGTYFLIIFLLVSSNTVVKETRTFEKLSSLPVEEGACAVLMSSVEADLSHRNRVCFF